MSGPVEPVRVVEAGDPEALSIEHQRVNEMAELMKHELDANMAKKKGREGWMAARPVDHVLQTYYHTGKLQVALKNLESLLERKDATNSELQYNQAQVLEYAADVANHAMMVLDVLGLLNDPKHLLKKPIQATKSKVKRKKRKTYNREYDSFS